MVPMGKEGLNCFADHLQPVDELEVGVEQND